MFVNEGKENISYYMKRGANANDKWCERIGWIQSVEKCNLTHKDSSFKVAATFFLPRAALQRRISQGHAKFIKHHVCTGEITSNGKFSFKCISLTNFFFHGNELIFLYLVHSIYKQMRIFGQIHVSLRYTSSPITSSIISKLLLNFRKHTCMCGD